MHRDYRDESGIEDTCPYIDDVIFDLQALKCQQNKNEIDGIVKNLEKIRSIVSDLREWGNKMYREVEEREE